MNSLFESIGQVASMLTQNMSLEHVESVSRGIAPLEFVAIDSKPESPEVAEETVLMSELDERPSQMRIMIDAARDEAAHQTRSQCEHEFELRSLAERARVNKLFREAARDRKRYLAEAESQVVRLALAIARKILAREASTDSMHLTAIVKAALARIHDSSGSTLRVNPTQLEEWKTLLSETDKALQVVGDERLENGSVVLETRVGHVELGIHAQLAEVERGLEELMQRSASE